MTAGLDPNRATTNETTPTAVQRDEGLENLMTTGLGTQPTAAPSSHSSATTDRVYDYSRPSARFLAVERDRYHPGKPRSETAAIPALGSPEAQLRITTDQYTAWLHGGGNIRFLLEKAGIYRRKWDREQRCWKIPKGEVDGLIEYAMDEWRIVTIDGAYAKRRDAWGS